MSIASQISVEELTATANLVQSDTYRSFEVYLVVAVKRVRGMRLVGLARRHTARRSAAPAVAVNHNQDSS